MSKLHVVGLGYGSIVASIAARNLRKTNVGRIGRITVLDPPVMESGLQLLPGYADFVDVVRTTGGDSSGQSMIGHVEFIFNGAQSHPGSIPGRAGYAINHEYAAFLFVNSVLHNDNDYFGKRCPTFEEFKAGRCGVCADDCIHMGFRIRELYESRTASLPSLIPRKFRGRYHTLTLAGAPLFKEMILVNLTVFARNPGTFKPILFASHLPWQLTDEQVEFNKTFTQVIIIDDNPHDATFTMEISVTEPTTKLLKVAMDVWSVRTGERKTMCTSQPDVNDEFYFLNNC